MMFTSGLCVCVASVTVKVHLDLFVMCDKVIMCLCGFSNC